MNDNNGNQFLVTQVKFILNGKFIGYNSGWGGEESYPFWSLLEGWKGLFFKFERFLQLFGFKTNDQTNTLDYAPDWNETPKHSTGIWLNQLINLCHWEEENEMEGSFHKGIRKSNLLPKLRLIGFMDYLMINRKYGVNGYFMNIEN